MGSDCISSRSLLIFFTLLYTISRIILLNLTTIVPSRSFHYGLLLILPYSYGNILAIAAFDPILFILTSTCIKSRTSLNFDQFGPLTTELAALERPKHFPLDSGG